MSLTRDQQSQLKKAIDKMDIELPFAFDLGDIMDILVNSYGADEVTDAAEEAWARYNDAQGPRE